MGFHRRGVGAETSGRVVAVSDWNDKIITEFRENDGEVGGPFAGAPLLLLHSTGAKSGQERVHPIMYQAVDDGYAVFASKAGADTNPDWYHNLVAHPEATIRSERIGSRSGLGSPTATSGSGSGRRRRSGSKASPTTNARPAGRSRCWCWNPLADDADPAETVTLRRGALGALVVTLVVINLLAYLFPDADVAVAGGFVVVLVVLARVAGLTRADLGLAAGTIGSGARWGGAAASVVLLGYLVAAVISRVWITPGGEAVSGQWSDALVRAMVLIPLVTVIPEELAFRGLMWGLLDRARGRRAATVWSSVLFGLWHVQSALGGGPANATASGVLGETGVGVAARVVGTVVVTGLAGVLLAVLRYRSGSLLAPILLHWAVNGFGALFLLVR